MVTKTQVINSLETLPENLTIDQIVEQLIFIEKVQKGMTNSVEGKVNTKKEVKDKLER